MRKPTILSKQIVYHALQDAPSTSAQDDLAVLDKEIETLRAQIASTRSAEKTLRAELSTLSARVPTEELRDIVSKLDAEKEELLSRLGPLRNGTVQSREVSAQEQEKVEGEWRLWKGRMLGRKRICREMWERCSEVLPEGMKKREELWESLGLEGKL
ncbi:hypothetical protein AJ79_04183 [Helicocarpus griseus UAMH5409]|uniref:Homologous-pairing protein 2 winged helix domain-containing protein n=1 Tax=Helicocarpus griseus UAMH5409 TaxID=1447875 RepID=A0A2B7XVA3_9EURO|nr:hypothetical protein AJ79_04183 [Helicocarpus griseus UAMH5409]